MRIFTICLKNRNITFSSDYAEAARLHRIFGKDTDRVTEKEIFDLFSGKNICQVPGYYLKCFLVDLILCLMECYFYGTEEDKNTDTGQTTAGCIKGLIRGMLAFFPEKKDMGAAKDIMEHMRTAFFYLKDTGMNQRCVSTEFGCVTSGMYDVIHGETLTAVWQGWAAETLDALSGKWGFLGTSVWGMENRSDSREMAAGVADAFVDFYKRMGMPVCIGQLTGRELLKEELDILAEKTARKMDRKYIDTDTASRRAVEKEDILSILKRSNHF